ncbi:hypothetical protein C0992_012282 [Termitomyces sp. T32_za158]|nr:hypothetical protein C0992_012282 [Termitomyces sp. T32_za158]
MSEVYEHTTTTVIGFAAWELSRHPDKQARLREELLIVNNQPTYKDLYERLPYLDAVLKEMLVLHLGCATVVLTVDFSLRLYPALPYMERVATKDDTLPLSQGVLLQDGRLAHQLFIEAGQVRSVETHHSTASILTFL